MIADAARLDALAAIGAAFGVKPSSYFSDLTDLEALVFDAHVAGHWFRKLREESHRG